ncbi:MAG: hypothetical protein CSA05_01315 [Bacteroidia bacterium]|nr:MAG: hypothetical protein CSA05_01315 [Bacteroidia bacterium]
MKNRYPGLQPFTFEDRNIFFGRDEDCDALVELISIKNQVVLHSKSGFGKSSLLNAAIIPWFQKEENFYIFPVRFRNYISDEAPDLIDTFLHRIDTRQASFLDKILYNDNSLWFHFKKLQLNHKKNTFLIILDQFEEIFTYPDENIKKLSKHLAELLQTVIPQDFRRELENKLKKDKHFLSSEQQIQLFTPFNIKLVFSIRSDKMSLLNKVQKYIPDVLQNCYELDALNWEQAEDAIMIPASYAKPDIEFKTRPFHYSEEAIFKILNYLSAKKSKRIETFQLQILCQNIENNVVNEKKKTLVEVRDLGDFESIYKNYYFDLLAKLTGKEERQAARLFIEEGLIFEEEERRVSLYEGQIYRDYNVSKELLQKLVNTHLIRIEPHTSGDNYYEISHDTLIAPILEAKKLRKEEEKKLQAIRKEQKKAEEQKKKLKLYKNISYVIVFPIIILFTSTFIFFDKNLEISKKLAISEIKTKNTLKEIAEANLCIEDLLDKHKEIQEQKEQLMLQNELIFKQIGVLTQYNIIREYKLIVKKRFNSGDYKGTIIAFESLQKFLNLTGIERSEQAKNYGLYAWYLLFVNEYANAAFKANIGLSYDRSQIWINKNLALALLLENKFEQAKQIYESLKEFSYIDPFSQQRKFFRKEFLADLNTLEKAGIKNPDFEKIRKLLK